MAQMAQRYVEIERKLAAQMQLLAADMAERKRLGQVVSEGALYRMERYKALQGQVKDEIQRYNGQYALPLIEGEQAYYGDMGIRGAWDALSVEAGYRGIGVTWSRLPTEAIERMVGLAGDGSPLKALLAKAYPDAIDGMIKQLIASTALGINPRETVRRMGDGLGYGLDRILTICRTEQLRVFRMASAEQYRESGIVVGFRRLAAHDPRTCLACLALDGQKYEVGQELEDHPNGRCTLVPDLKAGPRVQWETGREWFAKQDPETQERMLGTARYDAWRGHRFAFESLGRTAHSDIWGDSPRVATMQELGIA